MITKHDLKVGQTLLDQRDGIVWMIGAVESCGDIFSATAFRTRGFCNRDAEYVSAVPPGTHDQPTPIDDVLREVSAATKKFPTWPTDPMHALAVLGEEFGELTKEVVQLTYEPHKASLAKMREEAIQTAAMALRFVMSLEHYQFRGCKQHLQSQKPKADDDGGAQ